MKNILQKERVIYKYLNYWVLKKSRDKFTLHPTAKYFVGGTAGQGFIVRGPGFSGAGVETSFIYLKCKRPQPDGCIHYLSGLSNQNSYKFNSASLQGNNRRKVNFSLYKV